MEAFGRSVIQHLLRCAALCTSTPLMQVPYVLSPYARPTECPVLTSVLDGSAMERAVLTSGTLLRTRYE